MGITLNQYIALDNMAILIWYSHYGKAVWTFLKKLKMALPYDPTTPLMGI